MYTALLWQDAHVAVTFVGYTGEEGSLGETIPWAP